MQIIISPDLYLQTRACVVSLQKVIHIDDLLIITNISLQKAKQELALIRATAHGDLSAFNTRVQTYQGSIMRIPSSPRESLEISMPAPIT